MDAFDADVLIYAAAYDHPLGRRIGHRAHSSVPVESSAEPEAM
ncbi:MAG: hypothetical protein ACT4NY_30700 [Pseudonocardiales bacterium]